MSLIKLLKTGRKDQIAIAMDSDYDGSEKEKTTGKNLLHICIDYELPEVMRSLLENTSKGKRVEINERDSYGEVN